MAPFQYRRRAAPVARVNTASILAFLHNESIAAVIGGVVTAAVTYLVVALTDWRRARRRARKRIPRQLRQYQTLVRSRIDGAGAALASLSRPGAPLEDIGDRFPVERIRNFAEELADHLRSEQGMALYNIAFMMEQADALNVAARTHINARRRGPADISRQVGDEETRAALLVTYTGEIAILRRANEFIDAYMTDRLNATGGPTGGSVSGAGP
jgi:hypothetical protein